MRILSPTVLTALQSDNIFPISLFEIGGTSTLRFTSADKTVRWNGYDWVSRGVSYNSNKETLGIESATLEIVFDNYDDGITAWAQSASPIGKVSTVYEGLSDGTVDGSSRLLLVNNYAWQEFSGRNTSLKFDMEFTVVVKTYYDMFMAKGPAKEQNHLCRFRGKNGFKGRNCGYTGAATECDYTFQRCKALGNQARFGGFPDLDDRTNF